MRLKKMMDNLMLKLLKQELKLLQMKKLKKEVYLEKVERSRCKTSTIPHQMKNMIWIIFQILDKLLSKR
jgi:hypothetical protein